MRLSKQLNQNRHNLQGLQNCKSEQYINTSNKYDMYLRDIDQQTLKVRNSILIDIFLWEKK